MQKHIKNYRKHYNIGEQDIVLCQVCGAIAVDIHHIKERSQGGSDEVSNLVALCRNNGMQCHLRAHKLVKPYLSQEDLYKVIKPYI